MPPETYADDNGNRVLIRHIGPAGRGIPDGGATGKILVKASGTDYDTEWATAPDGTNAVEGPNVAEGNTIALFNGTTGKLIKDSGKALSFYASAALVSTKQDKVTGRGLSQENYTTAEKNKLAALNAGGFRGSFDDYAAISAFDFDPAPQAGDYCYIEASGDDVIEVLWDSVNEEWTEQTLAPVTMTGEEIALAVFKSTDSASYDQSDCRIFTSTEKAQLAAISQVSGVIAPAYGALSYFDMTGTVVNIITVSGGYTNMVKAQVDTAMVSLSISFDNGGSDSGRLRYTGTVNRTFLVTAKISFTGATTDVLVFGIAKNGSVATHSRALKAMDAGGTVDSLTLSCLLSLAGNDYLEVYVGNTTDTSNPTVKFLSIEATSL